MSPEQLPFHLCFLCLRFSNSQMIYTNMPFCGRDCRSKSWMLKENGTLAISLCRWFTTWVFSVWNAFEGPQTGTPSWTLTCPLPWGAARAPADTPSGRDYLPLVEVHCFYSWLIIHVVSWIRNLHSAPSHPNLPIYTESLPALLLGDLHLFQGLITFCLDTLRDFL